MTPQLLARIRALIQDPDALQLSDSDLDVFFSLEGGTTAFGIEKLTAALSLESIASNMALILKRTKTLSLETDGPALSKELRARAADLRAQVRDALAARVAAQAALEDDFSFDFVPLACFP